MNPKPPKQNQELEFIAKCQNIATNKCLSFQSSFSQMNPHFFNQILKTYLEKLIFSGETNAEKYLQEILISLSTKLKEQNIGKTPIMANENNPSVQAQPLRMMIIVNKEREEENDQEIDNQWKAARSSFFHNTIKQKLSQTRKLQQHQPEIIKIFMQAVQCQHFQKLSINLSGNGGFYRHKQQIKQMNQSLRSINKQFCRRHKETLAIAQIIKLKLTQLQVITIQYSLNIDLEYHYEVSAFELFKVVHENRALSSVTLKGVKVKQFKHFINQMAQYKINPSICINEERSWMKEFKPSKLLKIAIDTQDQFYFTNQKWDLQSMKDLAQFGGLFKQVSVISVKILQRQYKYLANVGNAFQQLQEQLKMMGNIRLKIKIEGSYTQTSDQPFLTILFQMLISLTTVTQLQFMCKQCTTQGIQLNPLVRINRLLAMEQILNTIFQKNTVTHLKLEICANFLIFPTINTLQTIVLQRASFRRQFGFMSELAQSSLSLQSITYRDMKQGCRIEERLLNQIKRLQIKYCQDIGLGVLNHSPANIKHLALWGKNNAKINLFLLLPKLDYITQLALVSIDIGHELICTIPSPHLAHLKIQQNKEFANNGLEAIDKKWPKLRYLTLKQCPKLNESGWRACEFNGLNRLQIDTRILNLGHQIRQRFRWRGVRVY